MQFSDWQISANRHLTLQVSLPGVHHDDMEASLSNDASSINIQGVRSLPSGGRACLPRDAKVSANGRYEILSLAIPVPSIGDANGASIRKLRGGLRISMPPQTQSQEGERRLVGTGEADQKPKNDAERSHVAPSTPHAPPKTSAAKNKRKEDGSAHIQARARQTTPPHVETEASNTAASTARTGSSLQGPTKAERPLRHPPVSLPSSTGIEVEEADFPWPEKNPEACEGWLDNRGEFQFY